MCTIVFGVVVIIVVVVILWHSVSCRSGFKCIIMPDTKFQNIEQSSDSERAIIGDETRQFMTRFLCPMTFKYGVHHKYLTKSSSSFIHPAIIYPNRQPFSIIQHSFTTHSHAHYSRHTNRRFRDEMNNNITLKDFQLLF